MENTIIIENDIIFIYIYNKEAKRLARKLKELGLQFKEKIVFCG